MCGQRLRLSAGNSTNDRTAARDRLPARSAAVNVNRNDPAINLRRRSNRPWNRKRLRPTCAWTVRIPAGTNRVHRGRRARFRARVATRHRRPTRRPGTRRANTSRAFARSDDVNANVVPVRTTALNRGNNDPNRNRVPIDTADNRGATRSTGLGDGGGAGGGPGGEVDAGSADPNA